MTIYTVFFTPSRDERHTFVLGATESAQYAHVFVYERRPRK